MQYRYGRCWALLLTNNYWGTMYAGFLRSIQLFDHDDTFFFSYSGIPMVTILFLAPLAFSKACPVRVCTSQGFTRTALVALKLEGAIQWSATWPPNKFQAPSPFGKSKHDTRTRLNRGVRDSAAPGLEKGIVTVFGAGICGEIWTR